MKTDQTSEKIFTYNNIPVRKPYSQKASGYALRFKIIYQSSIS